MSQVPTDAPITLPAPPRAAALLLAGATAIVVLLGIASAVCKFVLGIAHGPLDVVTILDFRAEAALPAWYTSCLLMLAGLLLALFAWVARVRREPFAWHWLALGVIFVLLSADETIQFHERASWPFERELQLKGPFLYGWVIPALVFVAVVGITYLKFLAHLPRRTRWLFVLAGAIYVGAAVGWEMVEGVYATRYGMETGPFAVMVAVEETMEMSGVALFIYAMIDHARARWGSLTFRLEPPT